jgi:hydroxymethylglutaryl-CoA reductase (NADPH)
MNLRLAKNVTQRRESLEKLLAIKLPAIGSFCIDESIASKRNCENMIGSIQIPVGVAGPVKIKEFNKPIYIPLATTEGALVASVSRGCKAITESGGAYVIVEKIGATRGPVFKIRNLSEGRKFKTFLDKNFNKIQKIAEKSSDHLKLLAMKGQILGNSYYVRFVFDTDQAMGMNMVTIATSAIASFIESKTGITCMSLSGNYCVDKKASWLNFIEGRGYKVNAEVFLKEEVIRKILKTSPKKIYEVWLAKCMEGSALSGSMGFNAQFANVVAAFFLSTGQDPAHITEGSMGITSVEIVREGLYVSVYLPDLMMGTVGGGIGLSTQKEALSIIGTKDIASVLGVAVLAGEISLLASLSEGSLVRAHETLGRGSRK